MRINERNEELEIINEFNKEKEPRSKRRWFFGAWISFLIILLLVFGGLLVFKTGFTFSQMQVEKQPAGLLPVGENTPGPEADRLNILLLGLRGENEESGGILTDSIMVLSLKKSTNQVALISIPRDLFVSMPGENNKEKINYAYALGYEKKGAAGALLYSKVAVSKVTGLHLDYAVSVDNQAFKETVDILGGIDIYLDKPFSEKTQFSKEILIDLPAGKNHLDGRTALYFVRSRYSTSDFDRARRQQQVLMAIKDKAMSIGVLANPVKIFDLMDSLGKNIKTDMNFNEMKSLISIVPQIDNGDIIHKVFDTTPEGLLYSTKSDAGAYILLPQGDNFDKIREACKNIFNTAISNANNRQTNQ